MSRLVFHPAPSSGSDGDDDPLSSKHKHANDDEKRRAQSAAFFVMEVSPSVSDCLDAKGLTHAQEVLERTPILSNRCDPYAALKAIRFYRIFGWTADGEK